MYNLNVLQTYQNVVQFDVVMNESMRVKHLQSLHELKCDLVDGGLAYLAIEIHHQRCQILAKCFH